MKAEFDHYIDNYRSNCDNYVALSGESSAFFAEYKIQKLKEWFPEKCKQQFSILDFGCGDGLMTSFIPSYFPNAAVYGVDPSAKSINKAQQRLLQCFFSINSEDSYDLAFEDNTFDVVISAGTFHHIPFQHHKGYIQEIRRILKPQGVFVLFELNPLNPLTVLTFKRNPIDKNATMMFPWYSYYLLKNNAHAARVKFYCFFPGFLSKLRPCEKFMTKVPLGALYAVIGTKKLNE